MYQISLINTIRSWERQLDIEGKQRGHVKGKLLGASSTKSSIKKPAATLSESVIVHTNLINALQIWERRWQAEEDQRKQRVRVAETGQEIFFKRLPRLKFGRAKALKETTEYCSCCQAEMDYEDALHS